MSKIHAFSGLLLLYAAWPADSARAQSTAAPVPRPPTKVAIENTNAAFTPVDDSVPVATPARPTVTLPAHIPPSGYLQFEQGVNEADASPDGVDRQAAASETIKIALDTRLLVQLVTQPYTYNVASDGSGYRTTSNDPGDLIFGAQGIVHKSVGALPTVALEYDRRVRAGTSADLDVGSYSQGAILLMSGDLPAGIHYDSNVSIYEQNNGPVRRPQLEQSLALSHSLLHRLTGGRLAGVAELSHYTQPLVHSDVYGRPVDRANTLGLLFATSYSIHPNLVLDFAFDHGLTSTSTQWQGSFGFTYLLPHRLWPDHHPRPIAVGRYVYKNPR